MSDKKRKTLDEEYEDFGNVMVLLFGSYLACVIVLAVTLSGVFGGGK